MMNHLLSIEKPEDTDEFRKELFDLQHPKDCSTARILLYPQNQVCFCSFFKKKKHYNSNNII